MEPRFSDEMVPSHLGDWLVWEEVVWIWMPSLSCFREKEKAEAKDHKVLEIFQVKDDRIEELQNIVAKQSQEISELLSK